MYIVDNRRTRTNRRIMLRKRYTKDDFDFAILCVEEGKSFYIMPIDAFNGYASTISIVENEKRQ